MMANAIPMGPRGEKGQSLVEYAMILVLITVVVVLALTFFGLSVGNLYSTILIRFPGS